MNTKTCGKCVPIEEHEKLERQWAGMAVLCAVLMVLVAIGGVYLMESRKELVEAKQQIFQLQDTLATKERAESRALKIVRRVK